ncbi:MAG TPA: right-handed parallel beta-helix repeat-containing protein [Microlunatus sp.]|nr:right-handed parallel beta-helix repeat-containing protein [Microlunatus sp.]
MTNPLPTLDRRGFVTLGGAAAAAAWLGLGTPAAAGPPRTLHVRDFGALPDDDADDTAAIRRAIAAAIATGMPTVVRFDAGTYRLGPDAAGGASLPIADAVGLTLAGAVGRDGTPLTRLVTGLAPANDIEPATQFSLSDCRDVTLRDLVLDYGPRATTSGEIVAVDPATDEVQVDVFEGSAHFDGMRCYSANSWDLATRRLNHVAPLTIGANPDQFGNLWHSVPGGAGRRYKITGFGFSDRVRPGDGASWHFNVTGGSYNLLALGCRDLRLENLRIHNAVGAGILAGYGHNLTCRRLRFEPGGDDLAVGPRDAVHLSNSTGTLVVDDCYLKGVRWDPLVSRSTFLKLTEITDGRRIVITSAAGNSSRALPFAAGDELTFWSGTRPGTGRIAAVTPLDETGAAVAVTLAADLPADAALGTLVSSSGHEWDEVRLTRTTVEGNIGTAVVFLNRNLLIEGCRFANNAYHDLGFGSTSAATGSFGRDIVIRNNRFDGSAWIRKYAKLPYSSAIMTLSNNAAFDTQAYNSRITIEGNEFTGLDREPFQAGVYLTNAHDVTVRGNSYRGVGHRVVVDEASTSAVDVRD